MKTILFKNIRVLDCFTYNGQDYIKVEPTILRTPNKTTFIVNALYMDDDHQGDWFEDDVDVQITW